MGYLEANADPIKEVHGLNIGKLRAHEKCMMQHTRCGEHCMPGAQRSAPEGPGRAQCLRGAVQSTVPKMGSAEQSAQEGQ